MSIKLPKKCPTCKNELEYISDMHLIPDTNPQQAGIENICGNCNSVIYIRFKIFKIELTAFGEEG